MRISIFGLGYVGSVSAACLAKLGHEVLGVDTSDVKIELLSQGKAPVIEHDLEPLIAEAVNAGRLRVAQSSREAVDASDLSLICVGTPSKPNGDLDLTHIRTVCLEIGEALASKREPHVVVIRSTVLPGTVRGVVIPILEEASGKKAGVDFGIANNPEFLREGSAITDFFEPPKTVIGAIDDRSANLVASLYDGLPARIVRTSIEVGEMVKYSDNVWHALKVAFANEIGSICKAVGIDSHQVMDIFCQDTKLNISPQYLRPGFAFGGSCLPKDVRALTYRARALDLEIPLLSAILPSNVRQIARGFEEIVAAGKRHVSVLGVSFKSGTDDLRESPILNVVERLIGKGYDVRIFDPNVNMSKLVGANREFLLRVIPHVSRLLTGTIDEALVHGQTIVIGNRNPDFLNIASRLTDEQVVVDLVRIADRDAVKGAYRGINW